MPWWKHDSQYQDTRHEIPCHATEVVLKRLKEEIIHLKDEGWVLMGFNELR